MLPEDIVHLTAYLHTLKVLPASANDPHWDPATRAKPKNYFGDNLDPTNNPAVVFGESAEEKWRTPGAKKQACATCHGEIVNQKMRGVAPMYPKYSERYGRAPIQVATGEHCQNRVLFKQFLQAGAIGVLQIDSCRIGGVNEILSVLLMAEKFGVPVCPHAGGVGLCEYVQHLSIFDYIAVSGSLENRVIEYVDHLHEHFLDPVTMWNGHYLPPTKPGYSIEMKPGSLARHAFPNGPAWQPGTGA